MKLSKKNAARQSAISRALASGKGLGGLLVGIATAVVGGCSERSPSTVMGDYPAPQQLNTERETRDASVMGKMILKDGKPLNYDAATGVVWSVGESGDFDYSKLPVEKSKRLRGEFGRNVDYCAFRIDGKPLNLMDNAK